MAKKDPKFKYKSKEFFFPVLMISERLKRVHSKSKIALLYFEKKSNFFRRITICYFMQNCTTTCCKDLPYFLAQLPKEIM